MVVSAILNASGSKNNIIIIIMVSNNEKQRNYDTWRIIKIYWIILLYVYLLEH